MALVSAGACLNPPFPASATAPLPELTEWRPPAPIIGLEIHYLNGMRTGPTHDVDLAAYAIRADGAYEFVTDQAVWTSSDMVVAPVPSWFSGRLLAVGRSPGTARLTATFDGFTDTLDFPVALLPRPFPFLEIVGTALRGPGAVGTFRAQMRRSGAVNDVEDVSSAAVWSSSDTRVATVSAGGRVILQQPGRAEIRAAHGGQTALYGLSWTWVDAVRWPGGVGPAEFYPPDIATSWQEGYRFDLVSPAATAYVAVLDRQHRIVSDPPVWMTRVFQGISERTFGSTVRPHADSREVCSQIMLVTSSGVGRTHRIQCREVR